MLPTVGAGQIPCRGAEGRVVEKGNRKCVGFGWARRGSAAPPLGDNRAAVLLRAARQVQNRLPGIIGVKEGEMKFPEQLEAVEEGGSKGSGFIMLSQAKGGETVRLGIPSCLISVETLQWGIVWV